MVEKTYVYRFQEGSKEMVSLLGGKGANLAQMARNGLPVPPGFIITTEACSAFNATPGFLDSIWPTVELHMRHLEEETGKRFGAGPEPLLVSVRSGAPISMPGMMDTILNLGLNNETVDLLAATSGDRRFALDSYRRFIQMYGNVVDGIPSERFEAILERTKSDLGVTFDFEIPADSLESLIASYLALYRDEIGQALPLDPWKQLRHSIEAVFGSWDNQRAKTYRKLHDIPDSLGTAVNIVSMVYGNLGEDCGTGVCFTRSPSDGENKIYGEFLVNAQGEDVVAGIRTPLPIDELRFVMPDMYNQLAAVCEQLERSYGDMQDIEFTIERKKLFILQTRSGKRSAQAAVKIAIDLFDAGMIDKTTAVSRVTPEQAENLLHKQVDPRTTAEVIAKGLPASPGAGVGVVAFDPDDAVAMSKEGKRVILVRPETNPDDIHGLFVADGVVTSRGGMTSHAAVVARGLGKPCVSGCEDITIDVEQKILFAQEMMIHEGDTITVDGSSGRVLFGAVPLVEASFSEEFEKILQWADEIAKLQVWANGDTPEDAKRARAFGAKGIGLCRTEHMFMAEDRLPIMHRMIVADSERERKAALDTLHGMQMTDFEGIFRNMRGLPVIIRLLDPPLHEFLPKEADLKEQLVELENNGKGITIEADGLRKMLIKVESLRESNPMMGFRGCRLGIVYPEIYFMQVRAIFDALTLVHKDGFDPRPEIMIPLVGSIEEMASLRRDIEVIAAEYEERFGERIHCPIGTMIEVPRAAFIADHLAEKADFFSFGTNDMTQMVFGFSRDDAESKFLGVYVERGIIPVNPFHELDRDGVGAIMKIAVEKGRSKNPGLSIGICGEHGGNPKSIAFCNSIGLNYVSCSPFRVPVARLAAAHAALGRIK